ncbi:3'(2'),5'-bisphosphate nucleotidase CysQ [Alteromonas sp. a30]|uniref:3'(2'),5'-bisphosphate nucleotidase CysQ n=1 Tax=Alteromonas sp. a30 TaxID=2730917 RepID=UPI00227F097E|nr:3'(2'),5'-bisphosphate nucleotidase CysQ [Alteromonas sp. a30]MCY7295655.1 3'(2'),5'-bisphosphate nucleotidase CysQ [Alteromonas sp. a30]
MQVLTSLLDVAKKAAVDAGENVMDIYHSGNFRRFNKSDDSPVTSADFLANEIIVKALQAASPDIPIMSEEQNNGSLTERQSWDRYWLIDPIDGTKEFIAKSGHFAVNIALVENHVPVIGVIYWPTSDILYFACKETGAFKMTQGHTSSIRVRKLENPQHDAIRIAISREQPTEWVLSRLSHQRHYETLALGSCSLKSCYVAEGKADVFMRIGETGEWDTGAAQCIVAEAGGKILAIDFQPLTYNLRESLKNPNFIVLGDQRIDWQSIVL